MQKILVTLAVFFLLSHSLPVWGASEEQIMLDAIQKQYESVKTFTAKFVQKSHVKTMNQTVEAQGEVQIKKPGKMKWDYNAPDPQILISNQKTLWLYVPDEKQVTKVPVESIYSSNTPALFLAGKGKLTDSFNVVQVLKEKGRITVVLVPKQEDNSLERLVLFADNKNYQITGSSVYDKLGNKTDINFSDIEVNRPIADNTFVFQVPEGVELLDYSTNK